MVVATVLAVWTAGASSTAPPDLTSSLIGSSSPDHSCYYWVVSGLGCTPGSTASAVANCLACAEAHNATLKQEGCTQPLINSACHGVKPPTPPRPPTPPQPGAMTLTLLTEAAAEKGAVCLDGSPAGYYWRAGVGDDATKFLIVFNGGGWCKGLTAEAVGIDCASRATTTLGSSKEWASELSPDAHGVDNPNCTVSRTRMDPPLRMLLRFHAPSRGSGNDATTNFGVDVPTRVWWCAGQPSILPMVDCV